MKTAASTLSYSEVSLQNVDKAVLCLTECYSVSVSVLQTVSQAPEMSSQLVKLRLADVERTDQAYSAKFSL